MKKRISKILLTLVMAAVISGCNEIITSDVTAHKSISDNNYPDINTVTGYSATDTGILLHMSDGSGYYLEFEH